MNSFILGIPVFNEENTLYDFFNQLLSNLPTIIQKVIVINDGSTDSSKEILNEIGSQYKNVKIIHRYPNQGYGASMIFLLNYAKNNQFSFLITMDCDKQHKIEDLYKFIEYDPQIDLVSGSRYKKESPIFGIEPPKDRVLINQKITKKINQKYNFHITDAFCGFKRYKLKKINPDLLFEKGYGFPLEFWAYCFYFHLSIQEIAVARVYITDDRTFGENLDKYKVRYYYYLKVWKQAEKKFQNFIYEKSF